MIRRLVLGIVVLIIVAGTGGYLFLLSSLPSVTGRIVLHGLKAPIEISRDADGVPLITAGDDDDVAFGLGFVHAQDRLFQMELQRRYGAGRLSEILGTRAIDIDRQMRTLGLYRDATAELQTLSPAVQRALTAYAAGVNAFIASRHGALPPEFLLLRFAPEPWRPADSLVWGKLMDLLLGGNYRNILLRARMARTVSAADLAFLFPQYPNTAPTTLAALLPIYRRLDLDRLYAALPPAIGPIRASNNWVVDGKHNASGKPLLANDPHLGFGAPGFWYLARLKTPQHEIDGGTVAGAPFVVIGHNERIAWGFTTTGSDVEDVFVEKIDPTDPDRYLTPDGSAAFVTRHETITVRGAASIELTVRATRHGPVLSDALPAGTTDPGYVLALAAPFLGGEDRTAQALWDLDRAHDWTSFRDALKNFAGPQQNMVYADVDGTIGFIAPARVPIRREGGGGWLPVPGWTGADDWTGFIPFDALPQATNPPSGRFVSANNKIVPNRYPYFLSRDWDLPNRAERIEELLTATPVQSPEASAAIQADTLSIMARDLVPLMTQIVPANDKEAAAIERLHQWDFHMDTDRVAPLIFTAWLRAFSHAVLFAHLGSAADDYWNLRPRVIEAILTDRPDWCADPAKPGAETCATRLAAALETALAQLRAAYGTKMARWQWGRAHVAVFANPVLGNIPVLRDMIRVAIPTPGGYDTINRGATNIRNDANPYEQNFGAGLRIITDLGAPAGSRMIVTPGQSGNPLSRHFADLLLRWRQFHWLVPQQAPAAATLTLVPQP